MTIWNPRIWGVSIAKFERRVAFGIQNRQSLFLFWGGHAREGFKDEGIEMHRIFLFRLADPHRLLWARP